MIPLLLLAAAATPPVETAERAFAAMAQSKGQWTAFRALAAPDAQMLLNGPQPAAPFLKDRKDPPVAIMWQPARTITSCDGSFAFSTGPTRRRDNMAAGRYLTIWRHDRAGWHWIFDAGASDIVRVRPDGRVDASRAACGRSAAPSLRTAHTQTGGISRDGSLRWNLGSLDMIHYYLTIAYRSANGWKTETLSITG
jgi:hypothetical protein